MSFFSERGKSRLYGLDNIKFLLIFSVVLGHLLEISLAYEELEWLYRVIYSFHMPAFIFLAGYLARYSRKKMILQFFYTYILFQVFYRLFDYYIMQNNTGTGIDMDFIFPFWMLWYLLVLMFLYILIPLIDINGTRERSTLLLGCLVLSLLAGYENYIGQYLSLSRMIYLLPFFVLGFYWKKIEKETGNAVAFLHVKSFWIRTLITVTVIGSVFYLMAEQRISKFALWGSLSYYYGVYNPWIKLIIIAIAIVWIAFFFVVILPGVNRKILIVSTIGRNSFSIYLLHGFVVMLMDKYNVLSVGNLWPPLAILIGTLAILALCGNSFTFMVFDTVLSGNWIDRIWNRIPSKERKSNTSEPSS